jgi:hypothetical protein
MMKNDTTTEKNKSRAQERKTPNSLADWCAEDVEEEGAEPDEVGCTGSGACGCSGISTWVVTPAVGYADYRMTLPGIGRPMGCSFGCRELVYSEVK